MKHVDRNLVLMLLCSLAGTDAAAAQPAPDETVPVVARPAPRNEARVTWFQKRGLWGLRDAEGEEILPPTYEVVKLFSEGMAAVNVGPTRLLPPGRFGGKWGYIDESGALVIPARYRFASQFSDGLANVTDPAYEGTVFIDKRGTVRYRVSSGTVNDFRDGLLPLPREASQRGQRWLTDYFLQNGDIAFVVNGIGDEFYEGMAALAVPGGPAESIDNVSYGFIGKNGAIVIKPQFAEAAHFSEGVAAVRRNKTTHRGQKGDSWGYIDKSGKYVIQPVFNEAGAFADGKAVVHEGGRLVVPFDAPSVWEGGTWWLIDKSGKKIGRIEK